LTAGASDGTARLWDLSTRQAVQVFSPEAGIILDTAFSPDGRYALAAGMASRVLMWAVEDGRLVRTFELAGPVGAPSLAVSPDGQQVAVGTRVGEIALFDLGSGQVQQMIIGHAAGVRDLVFSPDGKWLLSGSVDGTARLWEVSSGTELRRYNRRPFTVHGVAFAPDGPTVLVAGTDGQAYRYDVDYQETIRYLCGRLQRDFSEEEQTQYEIDPTVMICQ
jgi:WD40 repeat protein